MDFTEERFETYGIIPVIKLADAEDASEVGKTLLRAHLPIAEVTFRTGAAASAIKILSSEFPDILTGAGTVLTAENVKKAAEAGARFIVSPGLDPDVVKCSSDMGLPVYPGVNSPSQIEQGLSLGLSVFKFFPAELCGGIKMVKALASVYGGVKFIPTGGIGRTNLGEYLRFPSVIACGGTWMVKENLISSHDFGEIERLSDEAFFEAAGFKIAGFEDDSVNVSVNRIKTAKKYLEFKGFSVEAEIGNEFFLKERIGDHRVKFFTD